MKITIECNEEQANVIQEALDVYSRLLMGQVKMIDELYLKHGRALNSFEEREAIIQTLGDVYFPEVARGGYYGIFHKDTDKDSKTAWDIIQVLRNKISWNKYPEGGGTVNFNEPLQSGKQELIKANID